VRLRADILVKVHALAVLPAGPAPEVESSREDAVRGWDDLNEVAARDLDRRDLGRRQADEVGELAQVGPTGSSATNDRRGFRRWLRTRQRITEAWPMMSRSS
jgi:hypothetical protein